MQALSSTFSSTFGGAASTGATASASTGAFGGQGMSMLASFGSLASSGLSMYATNQAAKLQASSFRFESKLQELQARQIEMNAEAQGNQIRKQLLNDMASSDAFFSARGIDVGSSTPARAQIISRANASSDLFDIKSQAGISSSAKRFESAQSKVNAASARMGGKIKQLDNLSTMLQSSGQLFSGARGLMEARKKKGPNDGK